MKDFFDEQDRQILETYIPVVKGISLVSGPNCEVSLHSLENMDHSVIAIENGFITGRKIGSGMIPLIRDRLAEYSHEHLGEKTEEDVIGIFYGFNHNGHSLKSVAILLRNHTQKIIGCIEVHIDVSIPLNEFIKNFFPSVNGGMMEEFNERTPSDVDQLIFNSLEEATSHVNMMKEISASERNRHIVRELNDRGIFNIRGAVETIAKQLGASRYTIYNYLRDIKY
ncbi:MAG: PAS domain-containing protein [Dysosmobacter sp.]|nr:PAS domain-containing protein [Dysosmobacter sp.]